MDKTHAALHTFLYCGLCMQNVWYGLPPMVMGIGWWASNTSPCTFSTGQGVTEVSLSTPNKAPQHRCVRHEPNRQMIQTSKILKCSQQSDGLVIYGSLYQSVRNTYKHGMKQLGRHMVMWSCDVYIHTYVHMCMKQGVWKGGGEAKGSCRLP